MQHLSLDHLMFKPLENSVAVFDYQMQQSSVKIKTNLKNNVFSFLMEGSKEIYFGKEHAQLDSQQFILVTAGKCIMTEKTSSFNKYRSVLLFFDSSALTKFIKTHHITVPKSVVPSFSVMAYDDYLVSFVRSLLKSNSISDLYLPGFLENKLHELLFYLISKVGPSFLNSLITTPVSEKDHFQELIKRNSLANLSIEELAFLNNMSISTFKRTFSKIYNTSPGKWFLKQRLQFAADLLLQEDKRPTEIYEALGFESLSSFTQAFKSEYGTTPRQFKA